MKKIIALLLALVMVLSLVACGAKEAPKTEEKKEETSAPATEEKKEEAPAEEDDEFIIGYNNCDINNTFALTLYNSHVAAAEKAGVKMIYAESNFNPDKIQANNETLILQGADIIVDFNVTPDAYTNLIPKYAEQGIPVIMIDTFTDGAIFFGANNTVAGSTAGNYMVDYANENWGGEIDRLITVGTWTQGEVVMDRCDGIIKGVQEKMPEFSEENYSPVECGGSAADQMTTVMTKLKDILLMNEDDDNICIGVYSEHLMQAIFTAVEQSGREDDVMVVSLGCEAYFMDDVKANAHPYWTAAVAFFPERYGDYVIDLCVDFRDGKTLDTMNYVDHVAVDRESVKDLYPEYFA